MLVLSGEVSHENLVVIFWLFTKWMRRPRHTHPQNKTKQGGDAFRNEFMKQEGIPGFVWYIDFKSRHDTFVKEFLQPIEAVKNGVEPPPPPEAACGGSSCVVL